jgi:hypothetical protein
MHAATPLAPRRLRTALLVACLFAAGAGLPVLGQIAPPAATRKGATVEALLTYPMFFHLQQVRVRGELRLRGREVLLAANGREVRLAGPIAEGAAGSSDTRVEVRGVVADAGRLEPGDPRLRGVDVGALSQAQLGKPWPGVGELVLLLADEIDEAPPGTPQASVRSVALEPERFEDQAITVTGRFRGRNLFGDQPTAPGRSRWDFVLLSGDTSIWVTGLRPRGDGFSLDIESRADTNRWLEVTGTVRAARGLVFLEAASLRPAPPPADRPPAEPAARISTAGPPPVVVFSVPTDGEIDISPNAPVRIQFSRDVDRTSLTGRVRVSYDGGQSAQRGEAQPPTVEPVLNYVEASRVLELRFREPLERFRVVRIELQEGIKGADGAMAKPWSLTFTTGG